MNVSFSGAAFEGGDPRAFRQLASALPAQNAVTLATSLFHGNTLVRALREGAPMAARAQLMAGRGFHHHA